MQRGVNRVVQIQMPCGAEMLVSESHDSIQRFEDPNFDHLRYWDSEKHELQAVWLGAAALKQLMEVGIPETMRSQITDVEEEYYVQYQNNVLEAELAAMEQGESYGD